MAPARLRLGGVASKAGVARGGRCRGAHRGCRWRAAPCVCIGRNPPRSASGERVSRHGGPTGGGARSGRSAANSCDRLAAGERRESRGPWPFLATRVRRAYAYAARAPAGDMSAGPGARRTRRAARVGARRCGAERYIYYTLCTLFSTSGRTRVPWRVLTVPANRSTYSAICVRAIRRKARATPVCL